MPPSSSRCLRSKRLRALLWLAAGGKCRLCGVALPDDWQADHVIPWKITRRTNVHEMQALCRACNLKKGDSYVAFRQHQKEFDAYLNELLSGGPNRTLVAEVTPGGGKSVYAQMATRLIDAGKADFLGWFVPRVSLADQAEEDFGKTSVFNPRGHSIRKSTNDIDPCRGLPGFTGTHQAVAADAANTVLEMFRRKRGILIIDECHHIYHGSALHKKFIPIFQAAAFRILLSGNLTRWDKKAPAFIPCRSVLPDDGLLAIDRECRGFKFIRYGRRIALREKAKIPIQFAHLDGAVSWLDPAGELREAMTLKDCDDDSPALFAALRTEYADQLLLACSESFDAHRRYRNPRSKMLGVTFSIKDARRCMESFRLRYPHLRCGIAVSKDTDERDISKESREAIRRFKLPCSDPDALDVLFTVQMAYEGLDVPAITHLACLTHIRSWPWLEQMFDRGTRNDYDPQAGPWESQFLYAFVPDDAAMTDAIERIDAEQSEYIQGIPRKAWKRPDDGTDGPGEGPGTESPDQGIAPLNGFVTEARHSGWSDEGPVLLSASDARLYSELMRRHGLFGSPLEMKAFLDDLNSPSRREEIASAVSRSLEVSPSVEEERLRSQIHAYCNKVDHLFFADAHGKASAIIKREFGKGRGEMKLDELHRVWAFLQGRFPVKETG